MVVALVFLTPLCVELTYGLPAHHQKEGSPDASTVLIIEPPRSPLLAGGDWARREPVSPRDALDLATRRALAWGDALVSREPWRGAPGASCSPGGQWGSRCTVGFFHVSDVVRLACPTWRGPLSCTFLETGPNVSG